MNNDAHRYDDIINLPHPTSVNHPRMSLYDRAAQFSPFAALTGHDAAIKETARLTEQKIEQSEDMISLLNEKLQMVADNLGTEVTITYLCRMNGNPAGLMYLIPERCEELMIMNIRLL